MKKSVIVTIAILLLLVGFPLVLLSWEKAGPASRPNAARSRVQSLTAPLVNSVKWVSGHMSKGLQFLVTAGQVQRRNEVLEQRVTDLEIENGFLREELAKYQRLDKGVALTGDWKKQEADVLAYGGRYWARSLVINHGNEDKVAVGDPVLHVQGLAGVVSAVSPWTSTVQLLSDPQSAVGVVVLPLRARGVVRGTGDLNTLEIVLEDPTVTLRQGEKVITSGMEGSLYPRGLNVGTIGDLKLNRFGQVIAEVRPAVSFGQIEEVLVLKIGQQKLAYTAPQATPSPTPIPKPTPKQLQKSETKKIVTKDTVTTKDKIKEKSSFANTRSKKTQK